MFLNIFSASQVERHWALQAYLVLGSRKAAKIKPGSLKDKLENIPSESQVRFTPLIMRRIMNN